MNVRCSVFIEAHRYIAKQSHVRKHTCRDVFAVTFIVSTFLRRSKLSRIGKISMLTVKRRNECDSVAFGLLFSKLQKTTSKLTFDIPAKYTEENNDPGVCDRSVTDMLSHAGNDRATSINH